MVSANRILIFYLSVGSGHQVAAEAVADALRREDPNLFVSVVDPFANSIGILSSVLERLQAASIVLTPGIYDTLWRRGVPGNLFERITDFGLLQNLLFEELGVSKSDVVIATHALPCVMALAHKVQTKMIDAVFGIVTDFGLHSTWPIKSIDGYFVGHEDLRQTLIYRGVNPDKIHVSGIPIRLEFEGLTDYPIESPKDRLRVLLIAGGVRSGAYIDVQHNIIGLLDAIQDVYFEHHQFTILTGNQEHLLKKLDTYLEGVSFDIKVLGFVDKMNEILTGHDILITKPGGLIIAEALASGICLILFRAGPGQESANVDFLARHGVAYRGETPAEVADVLQSCSVDPVRVQRMKYKAKQLGFPEAARYIAQNVLKAVK